MEMTDVAVPLPAKVAEAIAAVMAAVPKLAKGEKNAHANYNFASIDDFLEAVRPLCAKAGLIIIQDEDEFEVSDNWLKLRYRFTLAHVSGETWGHRPARTILVQSKMGSQAFGAAQSYVEKQFLRSLFQIATGEKEDVDAHPQTELPRGVRGAAAGAKPASKAPAPAEAKKAPTLADRYKNFSQHINGVQTLDELEKAWKLGESLRAELKTKDTAKHDALLAVHEVVKTRLTDPFTEEKVAA